MSIGSEQISAIVPAGLIEGAGEEILFERGVMMRSQFNRFLLSNCDLYFSSPSGTLTLTRRPIPQHQAFNPRFLIGQLALGPGPTDSVTGLSPVLPASFRDADLIGISRQGDAQLVNLSQAFHTQVKTLSERDERLMVYALVNTLTSRRDVKRVVFFLDGRQDGTFAGNIDLAGEFLRNEGIIQ